MQSGNIFIKAAFLLLITAAGASSGVLAGSALAAAPSSPQSLKPIVLAGFKPEGTLNPSADVLAVVYIPLRNQGLLYSLAKEVSTPGSPLYRKFMSASQAEGLFMPSQAQLSAVISQLKSDGLTVIQSIGTSMVLVGGQASKFSSLGLKFEVYDNGSVSYYTAEGESSIQGAQIYSSNVTSVLFARPSTLVSGPQIAAMRRLAESENQTFSIEGYSAAKLAKAYNATALYARGINGSGENIGILDFYGDPYIAQQLAYFDGEFGITAPPSFSIAPIGPYDPNLGISTGWAGEISLDVEASHAMAPGASITLFAANGALPLAYLIYYVDAVDNVTDLSQSFSIPESYLPTLGPAGIYYNVYLTDEMYAYGTLLGITFMASTGDAGGSGYSSGPLGTPGYPSTSPFVTAVGGTTTYVDGSGANETVYQTAWSNYGFVPFFVNYGGGTGGVSDFEPLPWYQTYVVPGYPQGRTVPDVSLNANVFPGMYAVMPGNSTQITGGTSEASPLLAGLVALLAEADGPLGLINPALYQLGQTAYSKAFFPVSFGYNIPWTASSGYNLVTGWGAPNVGELAELLPSVAAQPSLNISVSLHNSTGQTPAYFLSGQSIYVQADISYQGATVNSGTFEAYLQTVEGTVNSAPMTYDASTGSWTGQLTVPQYASGTSFVYVKGSSAGIAGTGLSETWVGYLATFLSAYGGYPYATQLGIPLYLNLTTITGEAANAAAINSAEMELYSYSISSNSYSPVTSVTASYNSSSGLWVGQLQGNYPTVPSMLAVENAYGFLPFQNGIDLQSIYVLPPDVEEPGVVAPGQSLVVEGYPVAPLNVQGTSYSTGGSLSSAIEQGSNLQAELISPSGKVVSEAPIYVGSSGYFGYLSVPSGSAPGLYTINLSASYNSETLGTTLTGSFYGQVYVAPYFNQPLIEVLPKLKLEGQRVEVAANLTYANGSEVKYGIYAGVLYPQNMAGQYSAISAYTMANNLQVQLWYNSTSGLWTGWTVLPSQYSLGNETYLSTPGDYSGPFDAYVSGLSADGIPTTTALSSQNQFFVQPYALIQGQTLSPGPFQSQYAAYESDEIRGFSGTLSYDVFSGSNTVSDSKVLLKNVNVTGTLYVVNSAVTAEDVGSVHGSIILQNSTLTASYSQLGFLNLTGSVVSLQYSTYTGVNPPAPSIALAVQPGSYTGTVILAAVVQGQGVSSVGFFINGQKVASFDHGGTLLHPLSTSSYPDGQYAFTVAAVQSDGIYSISGPVYLDFVNQAAAENSSISQLKSSLSQATSNLSSEISAVNSTLNAKTSSLSSGISQLNSTLNAKTSSLESSISQLTSSLNSKASALSSTINGVNSSLSEKQAVLSSVIQTVNQTLTQKAASLGSEISAVNSTLNAKTSSLNNRISSVEFSLLAYSTAALAIAVIGLALALVNAKKKQQPS